MNTYVTFHLLGLLFLFSLVLWEFGIKPLGRKFKAESYRRTLHYCEAVDFVNREKPGKLDKVLNHSIKKKDGAYRVKLLTDFHGLREVIEVSVMDVGNGYKCSFVDSHNQTATIIK